MILFLTSIFFFIWIFRNILYWVWLWQLKEYRLDRVLIHIRETNQGRKIFFSKLSFLKWLAFFSFAFVLFNDAFLPLFHFFVFVVYGLSAAFVFFEYTRRTYKRPVFTIKAFFLCFIAFLFSVLLFAVPLFEQRFWILFIDRLVVLWVAFFCISSFFSNGILSRHKN